MTTPNNVTPITTEPVTPPEPLAIKIAGADMVVSEKGISGAFWGIPVELWAAIIGFHRQASINWRAETVSYHKWCPEEGRYHTLIPWQNTSKGGLSINLSWSDPRNAQLLDDYSKAYGREFFPACTIHTHVDVAAFESGTDARDEEENPGWHITLGHLLHKPRYDFDFRMRIPKTRKVNALVDASRKISLTWKMMFAAGTDEEFIHTTPGTTDFHHMLERINAR